jgi:hypothetical protein
VTRRDIRITTIVFQRRTQETLAVVGEDGLNLCDGCRCFGVWPQCGGGRRRRRGSGAKLSVERLKRRANSSGRCVRLLAAAAQQPHGLFRDSLQRLYERPRLRV